MSKPLLSPDDIDLSRHSVIEASAGTGKTYTLEQIIPRLILGDGTPRAAGIPLSKILVVTFTEKATGELKKRVRDRLETALKDNPASTRLIDALDTFDEAPIFTIHAF